MPISRLKHWWEDNGFTEFEQFGSLISGMHNGRQRSIKILVQPGDPCLAGDDRESCRRAAFETAEKAIALAMERYVVESIDFRIVDLGYIPMEFTLELGLSDKTETFRCHGCGAAGLSKEQSARHRETHGLVTNERDS